MCVVRMDEHRMDRRVSMPEVNGAEGRGRPRVGFMDSVMVLG